VRPKKKTKVADLDAASSIQETGTASSVQEQQSSPSVTSHCKVIISEEEEEDDGSHRGRTLDRNSNVIMISDEEVASEEAKELSAEKELEQLAKEWTAGVYGFFRPDPIIERVSRCHAHTFICAATHCHGPTWNIRRFLDTKDAKSTSNLRRHALKCWGKDNVEAA
ncbi:hypothetical protein CVT25_006543, partial [Psilocybe cyanescens]